MYFLFFEILFRTIQILVLFILANPQVYRQTLSIDLLFQKRIIYWHGISPVKNNNKIKFMSTWNISFSNIKRLKHAIIFGYFVFPRFETLWKVRFYGIP